MNDLLALRFKRKVKSLSASWSRSRSALRWAVLTAALVLALLSPAAADAATRSVSQSGTDYSPGLVLEVFPYGSPKKKTVKLMPTADLFAADYKDAATWGNSIGVKNRGS